MTVEALVLREPPAPGEAAREARSLARAAAPEIVRTRALAKSYGKGDAIFSGVSLAVGQGERVALVGANGAGKSTLLKCLVGLLPRSAGEVELWGEALPAQPSASQLSRLRRQLGFVFQHHGLVRRQSVLSNVVHGRLGERGSWRAWHQALAPQSWREAALAALREVRLEAKANERADQLSGGQAQRVGIARALVRRPRLVIADEPAASLDPSAGRDVMQLFSELVHSHGITLIYTTHDMEHAVRFSDRVVALKGGGILFDRPSRDVSAAMLGEVFGG